jgi:hypothetical protein
VEEFCILPTMSRLAVILLTLLVAACSASIAKRASLSAAADVNLKNAVALPAVLGTGGELKTGQSLTSGSYTLTLQEDGNLVLYDGNKKAVWSSDTVGRVSVRLAMQDDCNLVLYTASSQPVWHTVTKGKGNQCQLRLTDKGDLGVWMGDSLIWQRSQGGESIGVAQGYTNVVSAGQSIPKRVIFRSASGQYELLFEGMYGEDAFKLYNLWENGRESRRNEKIWSSGHALDVSSGSLDMQTDCNLVMYGGYLRGGYGNSDVVLPSDYPVWHTNTGNHKQDNDCYLVVQDDGNLVIYNHGKAIWNRHQPNAIQYKVAHFTKD